MSGENSTNDDKKVENPESKSPENESASGGASRGGLFSKKSKGKHYPFSVPEDEKSSQAEEQPEAESEDIEAALDEGVFADELMPEEPNDDDLFVDDPEDQTSTDIDEGVEPERSSESEAESEAESEPESEEDSAFDGPDTTREHPVEPSQTPPEDIVPPTPEEPQSSPKPPTHAFDVGEPNIDREDLSQTVETKSGSGSILISLVIVVLIIAVLIGGGFFYAKLRFEAPGVRTESLSHIIRPKQGLKEIAQGLEEKGIIEDKNIFMFGSFLRKANTSLRAGEFEFAPNASMSDVLDTIISGKVLQHKITLAEGLTTQQILEIIENNPVLTGEIETMPEEGTLLPETYQFERGMTRQQIIDRMLKAQSDLVEKLWPDRDDNLGVVTPGDAITLASIVEKETGLSSERSRVSAVFNNRLQRNIRLQSDPTVIYGIVGGAGKLDRAITRSDLDKKTPYNTYKIDGLPPTPIANPGKASIEAVLKPAKTNDLYFVADGTGGHAFAETLKEHNENVARWRKLEKSVVAPAPVEAKKPATPAKALQEKAKPETSGELKKTTTLKTDEKTISEKPEKSDLVAPVEKPETTSSQKIKQPAQPKESLSEKVKTIFVKPQEAPTPREKPGSAPNQVNDKINVTPLPEQKVPQVNINSPTAPQVNTPQTINQGVEPTPELETVKPARPPEKFNPFGD